MKKNLAILGAGRIGQVHARAIASNESVMFVESKAKNGPRLRFMSRGWKTINL